MNASGEVGRSSRAVRSFAPRIGAVVLFDLILGMIAYVEIVLCATTVVSSAVVATYFELHLPAEPLLGLALLGAIASPPLAALTLWLGRASLSLPRRLWSGGGQSLA